MRVTKCDSTTKIPCPTYVDQPFRLAVWPFSVSLCVRGCVSKTKPPVNILKTLSTQFKALKPPAWTYYLCMTVCYFISLHMYAYTRACIRLYLSPFSVATHASLISSCQYGVARHVAPICIEYIQLQKGAGAVGAAERGNEVRVSSFRVVPRAYELVLEMQYD